MNRKELRGASRVKTGSADQRELPVFVLASRKAENPAALARNILDPQARARKLFVRERVGNAIQINVVQCVGADFESSAKLVDLFCAHYGMTALAGHVKGRRDPVFFEKLPKAQVERMAVVPAGGHQQFLFRAAHDAVMACFALFAI
jgi:hypothetical protein